MDWDMVMLSDQLKRKQEEMQLILTEVVDDLLEVKQECDFLSAYWKGPAADTFFKEADAAYQQIILQANTVGEVIESLSEIERSLLLQEKKIEAELQRGGIFAWVM